MRHLFLAAALCATLAAPTWGQDVFIGHTRYTGPIKEQDGSIWLGVKEISELLKLKVVEKNDGYLVGRPFYVHKTDPEPGTVLVEGTLVESVGTLVQLPAFAKAVGLELGTGREPGSVALSPPFGWIRGADKAGAGGPVVGEGPLPPLELNTGSAGQVIDWRPHLVRGRINLVHFWNRGEKDAGYRAQPLLLKKLAASRGDVYVILVEAGARSSALGRKVGMVPTTWTYGKALQHRGSYNGHSANGAIDNWTKNPTSLNEDLKGF